MESITFFGRLLLTLMLPLQVVAVEVVELVLQELQDHRVLLELMGLQEKPERLVKQERQARRALLEPLEAKALQENKEQLA
jgi:hypothetical protein